MENESINHIEATLEFSEDGYIGIVIVPEKPKTDETFDERNWLTAVNFG